jgi:DNA uptake protein ComE-like DNA-binding protein
MKHLSFEPFKNWFGYTRRERRASSILLILILAITFFRFIIPDKKIPVEEIIRNIPGEISENTPDRMKTVYRSWNASSASIQKSKPKIDLNTCDSALLESLPGIGPVLSARIIKYRNLLGGFASVSQLKEVYGLPEETFNMISDRLTADSSVVKKISVNAGDFKQLIRLPYFDRYEVNAILKYRELKGRIADINELADNKLITKEKMNKVRPYLMVGE